MREAGRMLPEEELNLDRERALSGARSRSWRRRERRRKIRKKGKKRKRDL